MTDARNRLFYSLPKLEDEKPYDSKQNKDQLISYIRTNIIGKDKIFSGPFGLRNALYLDYTASGKSLQFIEDYIRDEVLPEYGNTHTTTSVTSLQTTLFRHEARDIVRNAVHASEHDAVIFVGSGTTGAVHKLIHSLDLQHRPVVFVGPYEHHSNLLPWKEIGAKVIRVRADKDGLVDLSHLTHLLQVWGGCGRQLIGCFCAASNITGILVDVDTINILLHKHGALAFWDYATAGPYVKIDMNPVSASADQPYMYKDAVFVSCHKFVGGVQTPGILIAKKSLFHNKVPDGCGGGSIFFVRRNSHRYLQEPELKEEGGTPAIVEAIRAGLVFQLKQAVSPAVILDREELMYRKAREAWQGQKSLVVLGNMDVASLPIFSFLVYHQASGRFLHHNYVSTLLNDLFGIQARGGCACAGPYAMDLLGMDDETSKKIEDILAEDSRLDRTHLRRYREYSQREILRPGFTRINLPFFLDEESLDFTLEAVQLVAEHGWKLLPQYMFNPETGEWRQKNFQVFKDRKWLGHISYEGGEMAYKVPPFVEKGPLPESYQDCIQKAKDLFEQASKTRYQLADHTVMFDEETKPYRWFILPSEAANCLKGDNPATKFKLPFCPPSLRQELGLLEFVCEGSADYEDIEAFLRDTGDLKKPLSDRGSSVQTKSNEGGTSERSFDSVGKKEVETFANGFEKCVDKSFCNKDPGNEVIIGSDKISSASDISEDKTKGRTDIDDRTSPNDAKDQTEENKGISGTTCESKESRNRICFDKNECRRKVCAIKTGKLENKDKADIESEGTKDEVVQGETETRKRHAEAESTSAEEVAVKRAKDKTGQAAGKPEGQGKQKKKENKWFSPPKTIFTPFLKGVEEYSMLEDGDRVLVCLSGGKDSLSLLHTMHQYQFYCRKKNLKFEIGAVTVDPETPSYDPSPLKGYLASLGVPYFYESQGILAQASSLPYECASICSFCSRMKRGRIYACARREGYNVLALGQHLDDLCESFMMSLFHNGILRTMKAHYTVEEGDLRVIRPFVYVREKDLRTFAEKNKLPVIAENCPACFEAPKERHRIKQLLATQEIMFPRIFPSMMSAIQPIMAINKTGVKMADFIKEGDDVSKDDIEV